MYIVQTDSLFGKIEVIAKYKAIDWALWRCNIVAKEDGACSVFIGKEKVIDMKYGDGGLYTENKNDKYKKDIDAYFSID